MRQESEGQDRVVAAEHLCTIVTVDFLPTACVLLESIRDTCAVMRPFTVVVTGEIGEYGHVQRRFEELWPSAALVLGDDAVRQFVGDEAGQRGWERYEGSARRWALKPFVVWALMHLGPASKVLYLDGDLWFRASCDPLFRMLEESGVVLTPHWRPIAPGAPEETHELKCQFLHGIFNTGFIGFSKERGADVLDWWRRLCAWRCEGAPEKGLWYDQRYMDLVPIYFSDRCHVITDRGCNVSLWNRHTLPREQVADHITIAGDELRFLHVNQAMIRCSETDDAELALEVRKYLERRQHYERELEMS